MATNGSGSSSSETYSTSAFFDFLLKRETEMAASASSDSSSSATYEASCHCGNITWSFELSPPLPEYKILYCNCSICRRSGYLLVYPRYENVTWHNDSKSRCSVYQFNTKTKDQLFCGTCGSSIGIDFKNLDPQRYGFSARLINGIDLDTLQYEPLDGIKLVPPYTDLSGIEHKNN